ncbi:hypothetical protein [Marinobacterium litorale]|uniref:hypothetical protein n=1 Tax=Marinobacterium litorale TaxID=404770 RepID=UPI000425416C|nr:hypothetical protein [Marinobacterium litorale]
MAITKEQWAEIEEQLQDMFGRVELMLEGRKLTLEKRFVKENRLAILVFIDGSFNLGWGFPDMDSFDEFVQKVWRERTHSIHPPKERARIIKTFGKRAAKKHFPRLDEKLSFWTPDFSTAKSLRRKLQKLEGLEVVSIGYQSQTAET